MRFRMLMLSIILVSAWIVPAASETGHSHAGSGAHQPAEQSAFARLMFEAMDTMHQEMAAAPQSGDADRDFLAMMIPHHAGAVEMARLVLVHGKDPLVRQLAEEIIAGQQAEIGAMQARLQILKTGADPRPDGFPALTGHRGE